MAGLPQSQAIEECLAWLEIDRHASPGTVEWYRGDLRRFSDFHRRRHRHPRHR
ncbi:MAG TPA: hypothetical protein VE155_13820 [Pseudonocardiaceae bacterium]|nr:hypothetical protein [Pseudonocardiaceae bacterium]